MDKSKNAMGTKPIFPLLMGMSLPPMVSMFIQSMYNIVDSIFVAKLGESALTAVSIAFPLQNMVLAVGVGLGVSVSATISQNLGAHKPETANEAATHGLFFTAVHAISFVILGLVFTRPFLSAFTDDAEILEWSCSYASIVICLGFGSMFHITIEKIFQAVGNMVLPMFMQMFGALVNILLDPILIFGLCGFPAMGVKGAAVATVISQISACSLAVILFIKHNGGIHINFRGFRINTQMMKHIYSIAVPSSIMMALPSALIGTLNAILGAVSQTAVAVLGIYFKLQTFVYMPAVGVVQGLRPIVSFNYGAGNKQRLYKTIEAGVLVVAVIMVVGTVLFEAFPGPILDIFSAGEAMKAMGTSALRIIGIGFVISSCGLVFSGVFEAMGRGMDSLIVSLLRQLIVIVPLSFLFVNIWGVTGVWMTFPIAELIAAATAAVLLRRALRSI